MKKITIGILADVDAGKTTLSEALLFFSGVLRKKGRVDNGDAFLDTHESEKARGITIYSKQAVLNFGDTCFYLVDTPGHADFSAETERAAAVLDYALLIVGGSERVSAHTETLWKLLRRLDVPVFVFVNKTDLAGFDKVAALKGLHERLSDNVVDFTLPNDERDEAAAVCSESLLEMYDECGKLDDTALAAAILRREIFPCFFGSALRSEGVEGLMKALDLFTISPDYPESFSARVYKIERDSTGKRMTCMKLTGGKLRVREVLKYRGANGLEISEKVVRIRIYSGGKFTETECAEAGDVCAVLGLGATYAGQGLGNREDVSNAEIQAVASYAVYPPQGCDNFTLLAALKELQEEDPALHVSFSERLNEVEIRLMGEIQTEILKGELLRRFGLDVTVGEGRVLYKETVADTVEGAGHFEPLRHYAEVHLVLSPLKRGSGLVFESDVSEDLLDKNWQNLIISGLKSRTQFGVLTGSEITDMKITLTAGRAHPKHTEGGDFREASQRALRQGLMKAKSVLLEPYFSFTLTVPSAQTGRALNDLQRMNAEFSSPEQTAEMAVITGKAPAAAMKNYAGETAAYTKGAGRLALEPCGYGECVNADEVIAEIGYTAEADLENTADSVFCSHGAGHTVGWREADGFMHLESTLGKKRESYVERQRNYSLGEDELERIMEKIAPKREIKPKDDSEEIRERIKRNSNPVRKPDTRERLLLVDGYNIVFAWDELRELAAVNIDSACGRLADILSNFAGYRKLRLMLVFDAYKTPAVTPHKIRAEAIDVIYTKSGQTSDAYIEAFCSENRKKYRIRVATNDGLVQLSVMRAGALRMSANELKKAVDETNEKIRYIINKQ